MDVHPEELVSFGVLRDGSIIERCMTWLVTGAMKRADRIIAIGRCMQARIVSKGVDPERVTVIPNWVDDSAIMPVDRDVNVVRKSFGWGDDFVVMYGGNVGYAQQFNTLIEAANRIGADEGIRIAVVGEGSRAKAVSDGMCAATVGEYHPFLHQKFALGEVLSAADVHFISLREECTGLGVPSKTYAAFAAGRPIIFEGSQEGEVYLTVSESGAGAAIKSGDVEALVSTIRRMASDRREWRELCKKSRDLLDAKYAAPYGVRRYIDALGPWL
jgi:glycosyltransferase involved in cell wall biosynthesis